MKHLVLAVFLLLLAIPEIGAQCAMCKATAESAMEGAEDSIGKGLNSGIVYLMIIPYLLLVTAALVFFRKPLVRFWKDLQQS
jgi:hypothetical protein